MASRTFDVGTMVEVVFDPLDKVPNIAAIKFQGTRHLIRKRHDYGPRGAIFELEDCVSDAGVPYMFLINDLKIIT